MPARTRLSLDQAALALGVHYHTAYRWVRRGQLAAIKRHGTYEVEQEAVAELLRRRDLASPVPSVRRVRSWPRLAERFHRALLLGDETRAREELDGLASSGVPVAEIGDRLLAPALRRIGDAWSAGLLGVAEEHRASAICSRALARWSAPSPGRPRGVAVVCAAPGDEHELPGAMATAALRERHWTVHHLGAGMPADSLVAFVEAEQPELVVVTLTWPAAADHAVELRRRLAASSRRVLTGSPGASLAELLAASDAPPAGDRRARGGGGSQG